MLRKFANIERIRKVKLSRSFKEFFKNEKSAGIALVVCSVISLLLANSELSATYLGIWKYDVAGHSIDYWINDGLMAIFFLLIGLELKREIFEGELSNIRNALLPIIAAIGGVTIPALIHLLLNFGTDTQAGIGIPMATDIAFALGILALVGSRVPASLKVFLAALAVIDDLIAIIVIAVFYTHELALMNLLISLGIFAALMVANKLGFIRLPLYLVGGAFMWYFMWKSGVHATIAGVLLAFTIPFTPEKDDADALNVLESFLHKPVAFFVLPVFALANTGIIIGSNWTEELSTSNSIGILLGLCIGKVIGISLFSLISIKTNVCRLPLNLRWGHIIGAGFLGGIGFTMSIFITNLAFARSGELINGSKMAILLASLISGIIGYLWLLVASRMYQNTDDSIDSLSYTES